MEDQRPNRPSGLPRPSRLPQISKLPKPAPAPAPTTTAAPALRTYASREGLPSAVGSLRNPKLRSTASRDQLASSTSTRPQPSTTPSRTVSSPHTRTPTSQNTTPIPLRTLGRTANGASQGATRVLRQSGRPGHTAGSLSRSLSTKAAATQQWISAPLLDDQENALEQGTRAASDEQSPVSPERVDNDLGIQLPGRTPYKSRPSLSERTIETLSKLPSSPAVKGRDAASFYESGSMRKRAYSRPGSRSSRPGSSHQSDTSNRPPSRTSSSRPGSSSGADESAAAFKALSSAYKNTLSTINDSPLRGRPSLGKLKTPSARGNLGSSTSRMPPPGFSGSTTPSPDKAAPDFSVSVYGSKTMAARPIRQRPSLNGLFKKPSMTGLDKSATAVTPRKASTASQRSSATSCGTEPSTITNASTAITNDSSETAPAATYRKTSAALREQIAKAKAAKKASSQQATLSSGVDAPTPQRSPLIPTDNTFDFGLQTDPFNQRGDEKSLAKVLQGRLTTARTSGRLNIAALNLREIPAEVMNMYSLESVGGNDGSWAESVDLTRFVAADNELEMIADSVFPDVDPRDFMEDEEAQGNIFAGLETLDLHGNMLIALPMGLRRLELLTSLNLSQNRLANNCLEVVSQIKALKDLKLGGNLLYGPLDPCFSGLENLEILDLHGNNIQSLPSNFGNLSRLRILNISENVFETIPFEIFAEMPLTEIIARKNQLSGVLIPDSVAAMPRLQTLDVSANQLTHLTSSGRTCDMPALQQLFLSMNRLQGLPDITGWGSLFTLSADENSINAIPEGFTKLDKLRSVDFSSNDIRVIPAEIGLMDNLGMLRLSGNPLRDKKFCSATTDELKATLAQRLEPSFVRPDEVGFIGVADTVSPYRERTAAPIATAMGVDDDDDDDLDDFATPPTSAPQSPARSRSHTLTGQTWPVRPGGVLDRSKTESSSLHPVVCSKVAAAHKIRDVQLQHNLFTSLPDSLSFFADTLTSLSLAKNQLLGEEYLSEELELPALTELNLSDNKITSLAPLVSHLRAPNLVKLDVSLNRIAALPQGQLRDIFPKLEILLVSNNHLDELDPEAVKGLRIVNASNNDIAHLNPRLGLLDLESLQVTGNRFRVPKWNVLDRGTEATLRWLRSRVPLAEMAEWKEQGGHHSDDTD